MADAAYLQSTVADALSDGLAATVAIQPDDPVDYLAEYLLAHVKRLQAAEKAQKDQDDLLQQRAAASEAAKAADEAAKPLRAAQAAKDAADAQLRAALQKCTVVDKDLLAKVLEVVKDDTGNSTAAYLAIKEAYEAIEGENLEDIAAGEDEEAAEPTLQLRYLAATKGHEWILHKSMVEGQGVTFPCWVLPESEEEEAEEEEDDEEGEPKVQPPPPELPVVKVDSVLHDGPVKFFQIPKFGSYVAVPLRYKSWVHDGVLPEVPEDAGDEEAEDAGEQDEEEDEVEGEGKESKADEADDTPKIPEGTVKEVDLAMCVDTVGQNRPLSDAHVAVVKAWAALLKEALERTEQAAYEADWKMLEDLRQQNNTVLADWENIVAPVQEEVDADKGAALADAGDEPAEELTALLDTRAALDTALKSLELPEVAQQWSSVEKRTLPPAGDSLKVLCATAHLLGATATDLGDETARIPTKATWSSVKGFLGDNALEMVQASQSEALHAGEADLPAAVSDAGSDSGAAADSGAGAQDGGAAPHREGEDVAVPDVAAAQAALEGVDREALLKGTYNSALVLALLFDWANAFIANREASAAHRSRVRADEEARLAAEEEARLAAEAAAAAEEGEEEEED